MISSHSSTTKRFFDSLLIRLSRSTRVDGLWVGVSSGEERGTEILRRLGEALLLIKTYDPYRYKRVLKETERLWVHLLPGYWAVWLPALRRCVVDPRFILSSSPEVVASAIVHEATHGKLSRRNVGYSEELRHRVEKACMRQELAFASKIPSGDKLRQEIERRFALAPDFWADEASRKRREVDEIAMARHAGIPDWLTKALLSFRRKMRGAQR
jgi:hypothetical protein